MEKTLEILDLEAQIALLKRRINREVSARKKAETYLEKKALELFKANEKLKAYNRNLEEQVEQSSKALDTNEKKYKTIIENMSLGLLEVGAEHKIVKAYDAFCRMTGYEEQELIGKSARQLFLPEEYWSVIDSQQATRDQGMPGVYEVEMFKKGGDRIWVMISGVPIYSDAGEVTGSMGIHYDITPSKNLQRDLEQAKLLAEAAQRAEKQFLANMSHEIRTPLNAIIGMTHLLFDTKLSDEQSDYLNVLNSSANILQGLISDILDFSKIESGNFEIQSRAFNLHELLDSVYKTFILKLTEKPVELIKKIDAEVTPFLKGDDLLLNQILFNLLGNAVKFTKKGKIEIEVKKLGQSEDMQTLEFCIHDTGIGISEEDQKQIFYNYRQAKNDTRIRYGGTGLGLAITKQLVNLQGGVIWLESRLGEGSKFYFKIVYELASQDVKVAQQTSAEAQDLCMDEYQILVVEDNAMNRKYINTLLKKWNYSFDIVFDGKQALEKTRTKHYDIILMDLQMPVMNGYDATTAIRQGKSVNAETPIVALTASAVLQDKNRAFDLGMTDFLAKPFTPKQLKSLFLKYLSNSTPQKTTEMKDRPKMDLDYLAELYFDDKEYALEMFELFLDYGVKEVEKLSVAFEAKDWPTVKQLAHKLKPSLSMVGFPSITLILEQLEKAAYNAEEEKVKTYYAHFQEKYQAILPVVKQKFQELQSSEGDLFAK